MKNFVLGYKLRTKFVDHNHNISRCHYIYNASLTNNFHATYKISRAWLQLLISYPIKPKAKENVCSATKPIFHTVHKKLPYRFWIF
jgi:hypothetical protein